jgi:ParB family chromosome partitioning protein
MAARKKATPRKKSSRAKLTPSLVKRGLSAMEVALPIEHAEINAVVELVRKAGGAPLGAYREPLGGRPLLLASLPFNAVQPTPFQRDLSPTHAKRLAGAIEATAAFLDPLIVVRGEDGRFWTPNGRHRLAAAKVLGLKQITVLISPDETLSYRILALNTEKAHNLRDKSLEVVRMVRAMVDDGTNGKRPYSDFQLELESPAFLTIGVCYEKNGRYSGGAYLSVVNKCEEWSDKPLKDVLKVSEAHAERLLELDELVNAAVAKLKEQGLQSGYLKPVVVARINPLRWIKTKPGQPIKAEFDKTIDKMIESAKGFDASKVKAADIAAAAAMGGPSEE